MRSKRGLNMFMNPFFMWSRLAWKTSEMAMASAQVIGHRTSRLALAGPLPNARDRREFAQMGQEKHEAALESAQAMGGPMLTLNQQFAALACEQMFSASAALVSIATSRTPAQLVARQSKLMHDAMNSSAATAAKLSGSTARVARSALKPVHRRVNENARRLVKR